MTSREELIKEVAKAIYEAGVKRDFGLADWWEIEQAELEALTALDVFEKAHTPTDDEREPYLPADVYNRLLAHLLDTGSRDALLLAGQLQSLTGASNLRRRTVQGEPTDAKEQSNDH